MSSEKEKSLLPGNTLSMLEFEDKISATAVLRAMKKVNLEYESTEKEKLEQIYNSPELLSKAITLIVTGATDKELAKKLDITPFSAAIIRDNEFVKALKAELIEEQATVVKDGLRGIASDAVTSLARLVDPTRKVNDKVRHDAAKTVIQYVIQTNKDNPIKKDIENIVNNIQINNNVPEDAREAYNRVMNDLASIIPVANNIYDTEGEENAE